MTRRVLLTGDTVGGVWSFCLELAEALIANGADVTFAAFGREPSDSQIGDAGRIRGLRFIPRNCKLEWMDDAWEEVEESREWLVELEQEFKPDIVHLNSFGHWTPKFASAVVTTAHSCVTSWWEAVKREPLPPEWARYRATVTECLNGADVIAAPSAAMLDGLKRHYTFEISRARVIPNGCRPSRFSAEAKEPFVLTAGRLWDEAKNVAAVMRAARDLPWPVYLAGEYPAADGAPNCHLLGRLSSVELAHYYARASLCALPARYEPFGLCALEAALSGCALVLGDIESLREIWGEAAIFVPPEDPEVLASALRRPIMSPPFRASVARQCLARALEFTAERMVSGYREAYDLARECKGAYACGS